ncbi:MAG: hypothetical protein M2R45_04768 [Verrucomicrobia subdivision 3 bacterium]|nr:hypothetical protein [Limisphaerales bacterium]MCS1415097.1 hypothetical protein [Limisphaerales bacterium]
MWRRFETWDNAVLEDDRASIDYFTRSSDSFESDEYMVAGWSQTNSLGRF